MLSVVLCLIVMICLLWHHIPNAPFVFLKAQVMGQTEVVLADQPGLVGLLIELAQETASAQLDSGQA